MRPLLLAMLITASALSGCAVLSDHRVAAGCQVADGVTTFYALKHGAVEMNPILASANPYWILGIKVFFAFIVYEVFKERQEPAYKVAAGATSVMGCGAAIHNLSVIRGL